MGLFYSKPDESHKYMDLPPEIMEKIFSYIEKKERMKISLVKKQWFSIINSKIEDILITNSSQHNLNHVRNLINRFSRMKNLELNVEKAMEVNDCLDFLPLTSLALNEVAVTFNIHDCALWFPLEGLLAGLRKRDANPLTHISKIKINLVNVKSSSLRMNQAITLTKKMF